MIITIAETTFFLRLPNMWSPIPNKRKILDESPSAGNSSRWSTWKRDGSGGPWSWEAETRSHRGKSGRGMRGRQWLGGSVGRGVLEWFFLSTNSGEKLRVQIRQRIFFLHSAGQTNKCHYELCFWNECNWPAMAICKIWQLYHRIVVSKYSGTPCATMLLYFSGHCCEFLHFLLGSHCSSNLLEESVRAWLTEWDHYISSVGTPKIIGYRLQGLPPWVWVVERVHVGKWVEHGWFIATKPMSSSMLFRDPSQKRHFTTATLILVEDLWSIAQIVGVLGRFWIFLAFP